MTAAPPFTIVTVGGEAMAILRAEPRQSAPAVDGLLHAVDSSGQRLLREASANGWRTAPSGLRLRFGMMPRHRRGAEAPQPTSAVSRALLLKRPC
jgi:hypothetical protein